MASLSAQYPSFGTSFPTLSSLPKYSQCPFSPKTSKPKSSPKNRKAVTCQARRNDDLNDQNPSRRDLLIGLGGLYTASSSDPYALAAPLSPNLDDCQPTIKLFRGTLPNTDGKYCLIKKPIKPFVMDPPNPTVKLRNAAHLADDAYYKKFEKAIYIMRHCLAPDDPRSFDNQAIIHAAYCNGAYLEKGFTEDFQVHNSALFFPFHRWYLYFFERICAHFAEEPDFRLPFWNWDCPEGITMPERYTQIHSQLYDENRYPDHMPTGPESKVDLQYAKKNQRKSSIYGCDQASLNLGTMHNVMVLNSKTPTAFLGPIYKAEQKRPESESNARSFGVETGPHTSIHIWTGNPSSPYNEDMGSFHTAARDPLFYAHHANVDRMWDVWKSGLIPGCGKRKDFTDKDWLDTQFFFYDQNADMVQVTVAGCLDSTKLGYSYDLTGTIPWLKCPIKPKTSTIGKAPIFERALLMKEPARNIRDEKNLPIKLNAKDITFTVDRPSNKRRTDEEKAEKDEVLVVQNICVGTQENSVKFDVFVNDDDYSTTSPLNSEFAGSFATLEPTGHIHGNKEKMKMRGADLSLSLTEILGDLGVENDESIKVTLVPRVGCSEVTFGGMKIEYRDIF